MHNSDFFQQIPQVDVPWDDRTFRVPVFYYDATAIGAAFLTPLDRIRKLLPSPRMHPLRVTPWLGITTITAYEYRDCGIGPYNEVSIGFPVTLDRPSPLFSGLFRKLPGVTKGYIHRLPVTTEIARDTGVEFANYPKFLADIAFEKKDGSLRCRAAEGQEHILSLSVSKLALQPGGRSYFHSLTFREGRILRLEFILGEGDQGKSRNPADAVLELGDHPIAQELRDLQLGRMAYCYYRPRFQAILSPVLESLVGS